MLSVRQKIWKAVTAAAFSIVLKGDLLRLAAVG
jgi:hypothetical protein